MKNFKFINNITGWFVFLVATIVYFLTIEPTASWWDCGEYIATAYKLQVGHPPGAPLFQFLGRFFSLFAFGDTSQVALMVNIMSALSSSFTILFLFWTITMLAEKLIVKQENGMTDAQKYVILGSGIVGALAFTFSDSFWFSAVEGEVYAMSSLFTALVFWAILRWERIADERNGFRWIILICYLIGLSIGVHLLNLLAIPAIAYVIYFKKYPTSWKGIAVTGILSLFILAVIMYFIVPYIVKFSSMFELLFVNSFGLPFNTGTIFYFIVLISLLVWGIHYTRKKKKVIANTVILSLIFVIIGYSSFFMLVIRSNADTPIDENSPEDAISLLSYLNREQYGDWPIFHGQYFNAPYIDYKDGTPIYVKDKEKGKYVITDNRKDSEPVYDPEYTTLFPRMWSNQKPGHINMYLQYGNIDESEVFQPRKDAQGRIVRDQSGRIKYNRSKPVAPPSFGQNLRYFFSYQVGHMYLRYFMWNFAGRQNDIESQGEINHGNWLSGIKPIDEWRLGNRDIPDHWDNPAHNKFYFLPLILGLIGFFFQMNRNKKQFSIVLLLFVMTGLAIIVYLNQYPYQPRERDYAYAGSFYAFAIWIGMGVMGIYNFLSERVKNHKVLAVTVTLVCILLVPFIMAKDGWDDHDRSGKYAARDYAFNYLESCGPEAVLFTNGDNDTFPLWYAQEVEDKRTDVRVVNYMLSSGAWYVHQLGRKVYDSDRLPLTLKPEQYNKGVNMYVPVVEAPESFISELLEQNMDTFGEEYKNYLHDFISILDNSSFPEKKPNDYNDISKQKETLNFATFLGLVNYFSKNENISEFDINRSEINRLKSNLNKLKNRVSKAPMDIKFIVDFIADESQQSKIPLQNGERINFVPVRKVRLNVDSAACVDNGIVPPELADRIVPYIEWEIKQNHLYKNDLMLFDFLATNNWHREIYFANPSSVSDVFDVDQYCHLDGIVYRFMPVKADHFVPGLGGILTGETYDQLVNKAKWGNIQDPDVTVDRETARTSTIIKQNYVRLAEALVKEGKKDSAITVLDTCLHYFPDEQFPFDFYMMAFVEVYYDAGANEKANQLIEILFDHSLAEIDYIKSLNAKTARHYDEDFQRALALIQRLGQLAKKNGYQDIAKEMDSTFMQEIEFYQ